MSAQDDGIGGERTPRARRRGRTQALVEKVAAVAVPKRLSKIVAVAASAGGFHAVRVLLSGLPATLAVPVVVVQHLDPHHPSLMADILDRRTTLRVKQAEDGERMIEGTIYIAPPDRHLLVNPDGTLSLTQSQLVHFVRPSADLLFESVAASFGDRAIAVVLSGTGTDGAMGTVAVKKMGGTVIVQDQESSEFFGMPQSAIQAGTVDYVLPLEEIADKLLSLSEEATT